MFTKIRNIIFNILICALLGLLLLFLVFLIPTDNMEEHVKQSAYIMEKEPNNIEIFSWCTSAVDNFTDSIMLMAAIDNNDVSILDKVINVYRANYDDESGCEALINYSKGGNLTSEISYARYWHGYLITLKPLLYFFNYGQIRIINLIFQISLTIILLYLMYKNNLKECIIPYLISYLMLMPYIIGISLQYSSCFYIFTIGCILLMLIPKEKLIKYDYLFFLNLGIFTAYFDFLTYPITTLCIPLLFYILLNKNDFKISSLIKLSICWGFGYLSMWASKWIIASLLTDNNIVLDAFNQISIRSGVGQKDISLIKCVVNNYYLILKTPFSILMIFYILYKLYKFDFKKLKSTYFLIFIIIAFMPLIWILVTANHSFLHCLFVNKICIITFMSAMFYLGTYKKV